MAHFAFVNNQNVVVEIAVISNDDILDDDGNESEEVGVQFCIDNYRIIDSSTGRWIQASYNSKIRGVYPGIGWGYSPDEDIFFYPQPFPSWTRSGSHWNPPVPMPQDPAPGWPENGAKGWEWDEGSMSWIAIEFPFIFDDQKQEWVPKSE